MSHAHDHDPATLSQLAALLIAHADLVSETSEAMALDIATSLEALQAEFKQNEPSPVVQKSLTKILSALQAQDRLRQQMLVVTRGLELVSDARLPEGVNAQHWYTRNLAELKKRYVMREQTELHDAFFNGTERPDAVVDEIEFF